jgi:hypothetical protein
MVEEYGCAQARELLVELATGVLTGQERGQVLRHVAGCAACRAELAALAQAADALLLLAPTAEPPPGFEGRLMVRLEGATPARPEVAESARPDRQRGRPGRPARWRRWLTRPALAAAAAVLVAAGLGATAVGWRTADDRALAERYRHTLAIADGRYIEAARLTTEAGAAAGTVFLYEGQRSWLLASVTAAPTDGAYAMTVIDRDGVPHPMGFCPVAGGKGTTGYALDIPVEEVAAVQLRAPTGELLAAQP